MAETTSVTGAASRAATPTADHTIVGRVLQFANQLRQAGVPASFERTQAMLSALDHLNALDINDVYWAGRLTMCADPEDVGRYEATFALFFGPSGRTPPHRSSAIVARPAAFDVDRQLDEQSGPNGDRPTFAVRASTDEVLRHRDIATLTPAERRRLNELCALLRPRPQARRSRRYRTAPRGRIDPPTTMRQMLRQAGEPGALAYRRPRQRLRRLVLLVDVSGSMAPYAEAMLQFAHAAVRVAPRTTEVFTIGTRLTRVTRELRHRDPERALTAAGKAVPDWSGGTRLGDNLKAFMQLWGQRGLARGAIVVLCSDGWERGDPSELGLQLARLARLSRAVIWANPHSGKEGFEPATGGMGAALPHIDRLVAGHTLAALQQLTTAIADA